MAGKLQRRNGKILKIGDGVANDCCCGPAAPDGCPEGPAPCEHCDDLTPSHLAVTFSGISPCTCFTYEGTDASVTFLENPNTSFTLENKYIDYSELPCEWYYSSAINYVRVAVYSTSDGSCGDAPVVEFDDIIAILLERTATEWTLRMFTNSGQLFCDTQTALVDGGVQKCAELPDFANDIVACGVATCPIVFGDFNQGTDGTATIVCGEATPVICSCSELVVTILWNGTTSTWDAHASGPCDGGYTDIVGSTGLVPLQIVGTGFIFNDALNLWQLTVQPFSGAWQATFRGPSAACPSGTYNLHEIIFGDPLDVPASITVTTP